MGEEEQSRASVVSWIADLTRGLRTLRAPLVMGALTVAVLWLPDQIREVYRSLAQEYVAQAASPPLQHLLFAVAAVFAVSFVLWQVARELAQAAVERGDSDRGLVENAVLVWTPRLIAVAPFLGVALGTWFSWFPKTRLPTKVPPALEGVVSGAAHLQSSLTQATYVSALLAVLSVAAITILEHSILRLTLRTQSPGMRARRLFLINNWFLFPLIGAASIVAFSLHPISLPQYLGVLPIIALWIVITTVLAAVSTRVSDVHGIPVVTIGIIAIVLFEFFGLSDNHRYRQLESEVSRTDLDTAFTDWLGSRRDADAYRQANKPYPVFIVAAEGGGMYAALHAAKLLGRLQDLCGNFAQHVFAVSSVSGGSLGAAIFSALAERQAHNGEATPCVERFADKGPFEKQAEALLSYDYLSPLIWAGLFPDFVQRFLPIPIYRFDRAAALEQAIEEAWVHQQKGENPFSKSFFDLCSPGSAKCPKDAVTAPALMLNTTNVETGMQMVLSPVYLGYTGYTPDAIEDFFRKSATMQEMPLSTAVGLSARFPWLSPAGWHEFTLPPPADAPKEKPQRRRMSFVDGGYFEGSGLGTAVNLARYLIKNVVEPSQATLNSLPISINIITITGSYQPVDRFFETQQDIRSLDELTTPLVTMLQAWRARNATFAVELSRDSQASDYTSSSAEFDNYYLPLPLGWQLGKLSRDYLELFIGVPQDCQRSRKLRADEETVEAVKSINSNNCLVRDIVSDLKPRDVPPM